MEGLGERYARDSGGKSYKVPRDMNYRTWDSYNKAVSHETQMTAALRTISADLGIELSGLEYRTKTAESYTRKVNAKAREYMQSHAVGTYEEAYAYATSHVYDTVRYSFLSDSGEFTSNFSKAIYKLKKSGYNVCRVKNSLPDTSAPYRGVNAVFSTSDGFKFEVQFHTPESLAVKNKTHTLYEEARKTTTSLERRKELYAEMKALACSLETPDGAETIIPMDNLKSR